MNEKRIIITIVSLTLALVVVFSACGKATYTDPQTGKEYFLVTDENGEKVRSEDGELLVYVTDENNKIVKDENGVPQTEIHGFIGQIEDVKGVVEDYAYTVALPENWVSTDQKGYFDNKKTEERFNISIVQYTYEDYVKRFKAVYDAALEQSNEPVTGDETTINYDVTWSDDVEIPNTNGVKGVRMTIKAGEFAGYYYVYEQSGNTYKIIMELSSSSDGDAVANELLSSITYKPYTYYPDVTSAADSDEE